MILVQRKSDRLFLANPNKNSWVEDRNVACEFYAGSTIPFDYTDPKFYDFIESEDKIKSKREIILNKAKDCVLKDRQSTYNSPEDNFKVIAEFWSVYLTASMVTENGKVLITSEDVASMMILLKTARVIQNPKHEDNWIDIAGYAACGGEVANLQK